MDISKNALIQWTKIFGPPWSEVEKMIINGGQKLNDEKIFFWKNLPLFIIEQIRERNLIIVL